MDQPVLAAQVRKSKGKGAARRLRRDNKVPAIFYGPKTEPVMLAGGELTVRVHNRSSIRVLSYGVTDLIERLNEAVEQPAVESIRLVGPSTSP